MRYTLKDYQADAVRRTLTRINQARDFYIHDGSVSQLALAATTGAGKTVMAAAIIEALFFGSDEFDYAGDPGATVLWFSDDPALNEQSRGRIQAAASELDQRTVVIENNFSQPMFDAGKIYFLNAQKLNKSGRLVRAGSGDVTGHDKLVAPDMMQRTIYDVITNTIATEGRTLYFVLDEAHRGMKTSQGRDSIVQRLINGDSGTPPMPIVIGISATVDRFLHAMRKMNGHIGLPPIEVDAALVQESGLLKDTIVLDIPAESGAFDTTLLSRAVQRIKASSQAWAEYATQQEESDPVVPLLVVQVADKPTDADLVRVLDIIREDWDAITTDAIAHVFGEHSDLHVGQTTIPYVAPQRVQDERHIRVLLAKEAISTGWDCPRAEVLISFRTRRDHTYVHQMLGRMMRTPLARRIPGNDVLNSVDCLLPHYDRTAAGAIAQMLMSGKTSVDPIDEETAGTSTGPRVIIDPVELLPNVEVPDEVWDKLESIPTVTIPRKGVKPIRRLDALAAALSKDKLIPGAISKAHKHLCRVLDGRAVQYAELVATAREDVLTMMGEEVRGRVGREGLTYSHYVVDADSRAIEHSYQAAGRALSKALAAAYVDHLAPDQDDEDDLLEANITVAAIGSVPQIVEDVEREADELARKWLTDTRVSRKGLPDDRQAEYDRLEGMSSRPERISIMVPRNAQADRQERTKDGHTSPRPTRRLHLMADEHGNFPIKMNDWERSVLDSEASQPGFKAWYRNPPRTAKESLAIAYRAGNGEWKAMRPDFIFFSSQHDGALVVDIVDPHGHHLADALPKLRGLADFAEEYGAEFRRIESIAETGGKLRVLDFTTRRVRQAVRAAQDAKTLYQSELAGDY